MRLELEFRFLRLTKNTVRYEEVSSGNPLVGTLYIRQSVFGGKPAPQVIKVTVED